MCKTFLKGSLSKNAAKPKSKVQDDVQEDDDDFASHEVDEAAEAWKARVEAERQAEEKGKVGDVVEVLAEGQAAGKAEAGRDDDH